MPQKRSANRINTLKTQAVDKLTGEGGRKVELEQIAKKAVEEISGILGSSIEDERLGYYQEKSRANLRTVFDELRMREFTMYYTMSGPGEQFTRARRNEGLWCDMLCSYSDNFSEKIEGEENLHADYWFVGNSRYGGLNFPIQHKCIGHAKSPVSGDGQVSLAVNWSKNPNKSSSDFRVNANVLLNWWPPTKGSYNKYRSGVYLIPKEIVNSVLAEPSIVERLERQSEKHNKTNTAFDGEVISRWMDYCLDNELAVIYTGSVTANLAEDCRISDWTSTVFDIDNSKSQTKIDDY